MLSLPSVEFALFRRAQSGRALTLARWRNAIRWAVRDASVEKLCWMIGREQMPAEVRREIAHLVALGCIHAFPGAKARRRLVDARLTHAGRRTKHMLYMAIRGMTTTQAINAILEEEKKWLLLSEKSKEVTFDTIRESVTRAKQRSRRKLKRP